MTDAMQTEYATHPDTDDIVRFTGGTLTEADRAKIIEHLTACVDCSWTAHEAEVLLP